MNRFGSNNIGFSNSVTSLSRSLGQRSKLTSFAQPKRFQSSSQLTRPHTWSGATLQRFLLLINNTTTSKSCQSRSQPTSSRWHTPHTCSPSFSKRQSSHWIWWERPTQHESGVTYQRKRPRTTSRSSLARGARWRNSTGVKSSQFFSFRAAKICIGVMFIASLSMWNRQQALGHFRSPLFFSIAVEIIISLITIPLLKRRSHRLILKFTED